MEVGEGAATAEMLDAVLPVVEVRGDAGEEEEELLEAVPEVEARNGVILAETFGAQLARPSSNLMSSVFRCFRMSGFARDFVKRSAGLSLPKTLKSSRSPVRIRSWIHNKATARWRMRPMPLRFAMPIAAELSDHS